MTLKATDYWQQKMFHIIEISHPYLFRDKEMLKEIIIERANLAYEKYLSLLKEGKEVIFAREEAKEELLDGYQWSPTDFLRSLYSSEFNKNLKEEECIDKYFELKEIFDEYSGFDLFTNVEKEEELRVGMIAAIELNESTPQKRPEIN